MIFRRLMVGALAAASLAALAYADDADDRALVARTAAQREAAKVKREAPAPVQATPAAAPAQPAPAAAAPADEATGQERQANIDLVIAQVRVDLIQARKAYRAGDSATAVAKAKSVLAAIAKLPADVDASQYELQAEGILAKSGASVGGARSTPAPAPAAPRREPTPTLSDGGAVADQVVTTRQTPGDSGYRPRTQLVDPADVQAQDRARIDYQAALAQSYGAWEADHLVDAHAARQGPGPGEVIQYPANWPEIVKKRERYKTGRVAQGPSFRDKDGRDWFMAVYEINDLTYVPPDFQPARGLTPDEELRNQLDRDALRNRSQIFNGWPEDLAAGIPLLRFFGGVDDFALRGPKFSAEKHREIVEMVRAFTAAHNFEPRVDSVGP